MKKIKWNEVAMFMCAVAGMMLVIMMMLFGAGCFGKAHAAQVEQEPVVKYVEVQKEQMFDTSIIEAQWCGGFEDGTVRMVGAWWYADGVVEDEQRQLWAVEQSINTDDFLLLWIADNNTPNNTTDDLIIKVWREAY
ncbi:MAG: hypothetical protein IJW63_12050 [Lachnospiraceae bacterium]|nr:hypothetical protein [Lachnospiraceae bacterium]